MAMFAIILGGIQLSMKKGGAIHKLLGRIWVALMLIVAITSFFIHEIKLWGDYSPIHLLSLWTIFILGNYARVGNVKRHKQTMIFIFFFFNRSRFFYANAWTCYAPNFNRMKSLIKKF